MTQTPGPARAGRRRARCALGTVAVALALILPTGCTDGGGPSLPVGGLALAVTAARTVTRHDEPGTVTLTFALNPPDAGSTVVALLAAPPSSALEVLADGSAVIRDATGAMVTGVAAPVGPVGPGRRYDVLAPDLLAVVVDAEVDPAVATASDGSAVEVSVRISDRAIDSVEWGEREGGRSLAVVPTAWARTAGDAGLALAWSQVVAAEPDAASATMYDQLLCHTIGAPDKAAWNLEPWRPDVGTLAVLAASCNPT